MKKFLVIGLGNFGSTVALELVKLKNRITAIDLEEEKVGDLKEQIPLVALIGDATDRKTLEQIEVSQFDGVVVSTGKDSHASILIAMYLHELDAKRILVKANSVDHSKILKKVGATDVIIPEKEMATKLAHSLASPNLIDYLPLSDEYQLAEIEAPKKFHNQQLIELQLRSKYNIQVIAAKDTQTDKVLMIMDGTFVIKPNHLLFVLGKENDINNLRE